LMGVRAGAPDNRPNQEQKEKLEEMR
jgi:hypothetical protein